MLRRLISQLMMICYGKRIVTDPEMIKIFELGLLPRMKFFVANFIYFPKHF